MGADLSQIEIEREVDTDEGRVPDLLLYQPDSWFLLLELKVDSPEGPAQTEDYAAANEIGPVVVDDYPEHSQFYGYIAPTIPGTIDETFTGIRWDSLAEKFSEVRADLSISNHPLRSIVQLDDFIATLQTTMPDVDAETRKRAELFFEYKDEIQAAEKAVDTVVSDVLQYDWTEVFTDPESPLEFWDDSWYIQHQGSHYCQFAREAWETSDGLDIHFEHFPEGDRFREGDFLFRLDLEAPPAVRNQETDEREPFRRRFIELAQSRQIDIPEFTTVDDGQDDMSAAHDLVRATYSYEPGDTEAYYDTLCRATQDHIDLIGVVDALIDAYPDVESASLPEK
jgi:hypothetical protein